MTAVIDVPLRRGRVPARALLLALIGLLPMLGCTTMRPVPDRTVPAVFQKVAKGDQVRIHTVDGRDLDLRVTAVDRDGITGRQGKASDEERVSYSDIESMEVSEFDWGRTVLRTVTGVYVAGEVAVIVVFVAVLAVAAGG